MQRPIIAIIGDGALQEGDPRHAVARTMGRALIEARYRMICGGLGGVMAAACAGAADSDAHQDGDIIGLLPGFDPGAANAHVDIAIATGLDHARNFLVANADAVIAIGGSCGTLSEIAAAWQLMRLVIAFRVPGWSGRLAETRLDDRIRYPDMADDRIRGVDTAEEAIALLATWLPRYQRRHAGIPARRA